MTSSVSNWFRKHWEKLLLIPLAILASIWISILQPGWELLTANTSILGCAIDGIILFVPLVGSVSGIVLLLRRLKKKGDYPE